VTTKEEVREQIRGAESGPPSNVRVPEAAELHLSFLPQPGILERLASSFSVDAILPAVDPRALRSREWRAGAVLTLAFHIVFAVFVVVVGWRAITAPREPDSTDGTLVAGPLIDVKEVVGPDNKSAEAARGDESSPAHSGGGQREPTPATPGVRPAVAPMPPLPPNPKMKPIENSSLPITPAVRGPLAEAPEPGDPGLPDGVLGPPSLGEGDLGGIGKGLTGGTGDGNQTGATPNGPGGPGGPGAGRPGSPGSSIGVPSGSDAGGGGKLPDRPPRIVYAVKATPTEEMIENGTLGAVQMAVLIGPDGKVLNVTPLQQVPHGGTQAAINAVHGCRFQGAIRNGIPVAEKLVLVVRFREIGGK
jgi:hypothetical protein